MGPMAAFWTGLVVGVAAGVLLKDAWLTVRGRISRRKAGRVEDAQGHPSRRFYILAALVALLSVSQIAIGTVSLVTKGNLADQVAEYKSFSRCQAGFNEAFSESSNPVREATIERDNALTAYLDYAAQFAGGDSQPTQADKDRGAVLFRKLLAASDHLRQTRIENPLPPPPSETCGKAPSG